MTPFIRKTLIISTLLGTGIIGAIIADDYIPKEDPNPANGPLLSIQLLEGRSTVFEAAVLNPAGITWMSDSGTYLISTDDRLLAEVSGELSTVLSQMIIPNRPLGIGDTEGVAYLGNGRAAVIGECGVVIIIQRNDSGWAEVERFNIKGMVAGTQLGSAAYDPESNALYTAQKKGNKKLYRIDLATRETEIFDMFLSPDLSVADGRNWHEFTIAGLDFSDGMLTANSEAFSSILRFQTDGRVTAVYGVTGINEASGLTFRDKKLVLIGDAENYLPDPPVYLIEHSNQF